MPFAVVEGEPVTELPRDLYIPPYALEVFLEAFEGPLDLLLYLIRRQNLDILDIPIAEISRQYVQYIELMKEMQFELAGEYLVMAATLAEIKSRMLLPRSGRRRRGRRGSARRARAPPAGVRAVQEGRARHRRARTHGARRASGERRRHERTVVTKLPDITLKELLVVFQEALQRSSMFAHHHVRREPLSVRERMSNVLVHAAGRALRRLHPVVRPDRRANRRDGDISRGTGVAEGAPHQPRAGRGVRTDPHRARRGCGDDYRRHGRITEDRSKKQGRKNSNGRDRNQIRRRGRAARRGPAAHARASGRAVHGQGPRRRPRDAQARPRCARGGLPGPRHRGRRSLERLSHPGESAR